MSYYSGDTLNLDGMTVTLTYNDASTETGIVRQTSHPTGLRPFRARAEDCQSAMTERALR
jgi:hypothetical protein